MTDPHAEGRVFWCTQIAALTIVLTVALVAAALMPERGIAIAVFAFASGVVGLICGVIIGVIIAPRRVELRSGSCTIKPNDTPYTVTPYPQWRQLPKSREVVKR